MDKIHINQEYGSIDMPSQIIDSFDQNHSHSSPKNQDHSQIRYSRYIEQSNSPQTYEPHEVSQINLQSSFEDTFLANLPPTNKGKIDKGADKLLKFQHEAEIALSKTKICRNVLPCQQIVQYIQAINSCSSNIILTIIAPSQIQILAGEAYHKNYESYSNGQNVKQMYLQAWEKVQIGFRIMRDDEEIGDIFQTITFESRFKQPNLAVESRKKRSFVQVQIHYVTPKLKISYQGISDVTTVCLTRISMNKISKGKLGDYSINITIGGIQRFEGKLQTRGQIEIFPKQTILYKDENKKINIKSLGKQNKGVIILKSKYAKSSFIFGVQLI